MAPPRHPPVTTATAAPTTTGSRTEPSRARRRGKVCRGTAEGPFFPSGEGRFAPAGAERERGGGGKGESVGRGRLPASPPVLSPHLTSLPQQPPSCLSSLPASPGTTFLPASPPQGPPSRSPRAAGAARLRDPAVRVCVCVCEGRGGTHNKTEKNKKEVPDFSSQRNTFPASHPFVVCKERERGERGGEKKKNLFQKSTGLQMSAREPTNPPSSTAGQVTSSTYCFPHASAPGR